MLEWIVIALLAVILLAVITLFLRTVHKYDIVKRRLNNLIKAQNNFSRATIDLLRMFSYGEKIKSIEAQAQIEKVIKRLIEVLMTQPIRLRALTALDTASCLLVDRDDFMKRNEQMLEAVHNKYLGDDEER